MIRRVNDEEGIKVWICLQMVVKTWLPFFIEFFVDIYYFIFLLLHFLFIETGEWDIPEAVVYSNSSPWQRNHDQEDSQHHWCGTFNWITTLLNDLKL